MARCYVCDTEISLFSFWLRSFKHWGRNLWRARGRAVSECPYCNTEVQVTIESTWSFISFVTSVIIGFMAIVEYFKIEIENDLAVITGITIFILVGSYLWWKFLAKLKEPDESWWEV